MGSGSGSEPQRSRRSRRKQTVHARETLTLRGDGHLRLVVVADTHSRPDPRSLPLIAAQRPDRILHAGDIGSPAVLDTLAGLAPVTAVRGNIDAQMPGVPDVVTLDVRQGGGGGGGGERDGDGDRADHGPVLLTMLLLHVALYGPKLRADAIRLARAAGASLVLCGHSHVPFMGRDAGIAVLNAGSIGPRRFRLPIVFAVVDISRSGVEMRHLSCETGETWRP